MLYTVCYSTKIVGSIQPTLLLIVHGKFCEQIRNFAPVLYIYKNLFSFLKTSGRGNVRCLFYRSVLIRCFR